MRRVRLVQNRTECLTVLVGRDWLRAGGLVAVLGVAMGLMLVPEPGSLASLLAVATGGLACFVVGVHLLRALRRREHTLVRSTGRLLLDGDPLELARVELKVLQRPVLRRPSGYSLTLWVMTLIGPDELPLGRFRTLLEASTVSGQLEEFLATANVKPHRVS